MTRNPITDVLRNVANGRFTNLDERISEICKGPNVNEELAELFTNLNYINDVEYKPSDFKIKNFDSGTIITLPNVGSNDYCMLISLINGKLRGVENECDGDKYIIDLSDIDNGPIACISGAARTINYSVLTA